MTDLGKVPDRRTTNLTQDHIRLIINAEVDANLTAIEVSLKNHVDAKIEELKTLIKSSVPDGDIHAHLLAHKQMLKVSADKAERWNKIWDRILVGGAYSVAVAVFLAVWDAFKASVNK